MDNEEHEFASAQERADAIHDAEAAARRAESEASVLRGRASRSSHPDAYRETLEERVKAGREAQEELDRLGGTSAKADLSGVTRGLSDSEGNFAANAEVLQTGGIGIDASNTNVETGEPAQTADEAGVAVAPNAEKIVGGTATRSRTSETAESRAAVVIADDWKSLSWQERRSLASRLSDDPISNGEEANAAIEAELARRG